MSIFAKIERSLALANLDGIFQAADGIMVARGDLGVELPIEQVPVIQKELMRRANILGKPVITATQMLESMTSSRRPTRPRPLTWPMPFWTGPMCHAVGGISHRPVSGWRP